MIELILAGAALVEASAAPSAAAIEGRWINPSRSVVIEIAPCGDSLCGTVAWATAQAEEAASRGTPRLVGTQLLTDLQRKGEVWEGRLFVPDQRIHAEAKIALDGADLKVSGCEIGICKSQVWSRAPAGLPGSN